MNDTALEATPRPCFFFGHPPNQRDNPHSDPLFFVAFVQFVTRVGPGH
jgi:hypothetical protein